MAGHEDDPRRPDDAADPIDPERRLSQEIEFHIEQQTTRLVEQGLAPAEARRQALLKFGGVEAFKDSTRDEMRMAWFQDVGRDVRLGLRALRRSPGFAWLVVVTLGLGIGASTALFSVVQGVLLRALPYPEAHEIVRLYQVSFDDADGTERRSANVSELNLIDWQQRTRAFAAIAKMSQGRPTPVVAGDDPLMAQRSQVSREFFDVMGVRPASGRQFAPAEQQEGGPPAAIISASMRRRAFGDVLPADATVRIGQTTYDVIGVMPEGFEYPGGTEIWTPSEVYPPQMSRTAHNFQAVARLGDGVSLDAGIADLSAVSRAMKSEYGDDTWMEDATAVPLLEQATAGSRLALEMLFWASIGLFVIACTNVSNLLLAREASRSQETALQLAIGAGRWRIVRQRLAETFVLCVVASGVGIVVATFAVRGLLALDPGSVPRLQEVRVDWTAIGFALAAALVATAVIGVITMLRRGDRNLRDVLGDGQRSGGGPGREHAREALVVTQVALTLVLLSGSVLLGRSFAELVAIDPGYRTAGLTVFDLVVPSTGDNVGQRRWQVQEAFMERLRALPGVERVGLTNGLPAGGPTFYPNGRYLEMTSADEIQSGEDFERLTPDMVQARSGQAGYRIVSADYFETMQIPLLAGRVFEPGDMPDAPHVAVVSESLAQDRWPDRDPIGRFIQFGNMDGDLRGFRVVGVVGDVRELSPETPPGPLLYADHRQRPGQAARVAVVVDGGGPGLIQSGQRILRDIDPEIPLQARLVDEVFDEALSGRRFNLMLSSAFGAAALGLAIFGTYGLISFLVTTRRREIGIRLALGATAFTVVQLIVGRGARLAVIGAAIGLSAALLLSRLLQSLLFAVSPNDPLSLGGVVGLTVASVMLACLVPALRATRIAPTETLR